MKKILEYEVIYNAFMDTILGDLPRNEADYPEWYKERLDKCASCKYNTKNIPSNILPTSLWLSKKFGKARCSICTCFIKQKAWSKTEQCAMGETSSRPEWMTVGHMKQDDKETSLWNRLELITMKEDLFNLVSQDKPEYNSDLTEDGSGFILDFGNIEKGKDLEFSFTLEAKEPIVLESTKNACSCTVPNVKVLDDKRIQFTVSVKSGKFGTGVFNKDTIIGYRFKSEEPMNIEIGDDGKVKNKPQPSHELRVVYKANIVNREG